MGETNRNKIIMIFSKFFLPLFVFALENQPPTTNFVEEYVEVYSMCAQTELNYHKENEEKMTPKIMDHIGDACDDFTRTYICLDYQAPSDIMGDFYAPSKRSSTYS